MQTDSRPVSKVRLWAGYVMSILPALLLIFSAVMKFTRTPEVEQGFVHLGWPVSLAVPLGIIELACTAIYLLPRTSVLGAILVTGYLGGAIATHVRIGEPFLTILIAGILIWGGLYLRTPALQALIPLLLAKAHR